HHPLKTSERATTHQTTSRERELLELIASALEAKKQAPSYRELLKLLGLSSPGTIYKQIQKLKSKRLIKSNASGMIIPADRSKQAISKHNFRCIPIIGSIAKGEKLHLFAKMSFCDLSEELVGHERNCYGFYVRDDSFAEERLSQGDLLIVDIDEAARPG